MINSIKIVSFLVISVLLLSATGCSKGGAVNQNNFTMLRRNFCKTLHQHHGLLYHNEDKTSCCSSFLFIASAISVVMIPAIMLWLISINKYVISIKDKYMT